MIFPKFSAVFETALTIDYHSAFGEGFLWENSKVKTHPKKISLLVSPQQLPQLSRCDSGVEGACKGRARWGTSGRPGGDPEMMAMVFCWNFCWEFFMGIPHEMLVICRISCQIYA